MVIRTRHTFAGMPYGAFGAKSYTTPQVECDVSLFDGKPTGWQDYCNCMFPAGDPNRAKCRKRPCANPFDTDPDCVFGVVNPALSFAPWTEAGAGIRGIPKEGGGLLYLFGSGFRPIEPFELEPDYFFKLACLDPLRAAYVVGHYEEGFVKAARAGYKYAFDPMGLRAMYFALSTLVGVAIVTQNIPLVGGVFTAQAALVLFGTAGIATWPIVLPVAIPYAFAKDPSGDRADKEILQPVFQTLGDILPLVTSIFGVIGGDVDAIATMIKTLCRRAARMLPQTGAADVEVARALLNAAAVASPTLAKIIKDPQTAFTTAGFYSQIGGTLKEISTVAAKSGNAELGTGLLFLGDTFDRLDMSMTITAKAIVTGDANLICCDKDTAFDYLPSRYIGMQFSALFKIADDLVKAGKTTSGELEKAVLGTEDAQSALKRIGDGINAIVLFAKELDKALRALGPAGKYFAGVVADLLKQRDKLGEIAGAARAANPAAALVNTTAGQRVLGKIAAGQRRPIAPIAFPVIPTPTVPWKPPSFTPVTPKVVTVAPPPGVSIGLVLAGAGTGLLIAGPVGALIGGGAAALLKK
jgi:hypothetical protein